MSDAMENAPEEEEETPLWERAVLRTGLYASTDREGKPCETFWRFVLPDKKGDNGFIRRYDLTPAFNASWGEWDGLTLGKGLELLASLESQAAAKGARIDETKHGKTSYFRPLTLEAFNELQRDPQGALTLQADTQVSAPLRLRKAPAP
jgi:hypothetical protein